MKLGRISVGSAKLPRHGIDDLLSSTDGGKHDYDWLLTPPGTPLFSSSDASEPQPSLTAPRSSYGVRSASTTKASRLSTTQTENGHSTRPARSSSVTRPSISNAYSSYSNTYSSYSNRTSVLNTSSASVTSSRPSTPNTRSTLPSAARSSAMNARPTPVRSPTPAKTRPPVVSPGDKARPSHNPRPSTPTTRPQIPANLTSPASRSSSRPSTPTRRNPTPALAPVAGRSSSVGRVPPVNGRSSAPASRASSPGPRARAPPQPIVLPDFPLDVPPNLRTTLPDRPISAGRSRPGSALTVRSSSEAAGPVNPPRRQSSSPVVARGRLPEHSGRSRSHSNGHEAGSPEIQKPTSSDSAARRPAKSTTSSESTGFGRTISKKSLDMALRHMDIRQSVGSILYPQSIRSGTSKGRPAGRFPESLSSVGSNGTISENGNSVNNRSPDYEATDNDKRSSLKVSEGDLYGSSRYDAILLKEDSKNTNWLHSIEDVSDQSPVFDHRFEPLPEPFGLL
ncbi:uncharacterized protein LOC131223901 isoform X2 [Magnolia sinica]|nr:uncharacterized protein LOC131223901 isoform X2 [Magnolia sinica]